MNRFLSLTAFLLLMILAVNPLAAQDQQETENSLLPEIDPQDIEIRSQFRARFPGLRRQPILGFDPTPRVYQIDPNRMPFMEGKDQVVANLPVSELSRPAPPEYATLYYPEKMTLFGRLGIGSFVSPEAQFWGVKRLSNKSYIGGDLDFFSSDGHLDSQQSAFRSFNLNGEYATKLSPKTRLDINGGLENSFNQMFNVSAAPQGYRKEYDGYQLNTNLQHFNNSITGWKAQAALRHYQVALESDEFIADATDVSGNAEEFVYNASLAKRWAGSRVNETFTAELGAKGGNYNNSALSDNWMTAQAGVIYERLFDYSTKVTIDGSVYYGTDSFNSKIYLAPSVKVEHPLLDMITLTVKAGAEPFFKTAEQLHSANRFLNVNNELRHSYKMDGLAELRLDYSNIGALNMGLQYENINDYPIFVRNTTLSRFGVQQPLFYTANYTDVYKIKAYAGVSHQIVAHRFWLNGEVYVQSPQIKEGGQIPYEENFGIQSGFSLRPIDEITVEAWANYVGPRETFLDNEELGGFLLLGGQVDVEISDRFGAYVKMANLLSQEYQLWQGYTERPFQVFGGVTVQL